MIIGGHTTKQRGYGEGTWHWQWHVTRDVTGRTVSK